MDKTGRKNVGEDGASISCCLLLVSMGHCMKEELSGI